MIAKLLRNTATTKIVAFLVLTLPLVGSGLYWTAINFPTASKDMYFVVTREDDTTFRIVKYYFEEPRYRSMTDRVVHYLLDYQAGTIKPTDTKYENKNLRQFCESISGSQSTFARIRFEDLDYATNQLGIPREPMLTTDCDLVVLFDSENMEISRWQIPSFRDIHSSRGLIASLDPLGIKLIVREASTGTPLWSVVVDDLFNSETPSWINAYDAVVSMDYLAGDIRFYELQSGRRLYVDEDYGGWIVDLAGDEYLTVKAPLKRSAIPVLQLREAPNDRVLREFQFPKNCWNPETSDDRVRFSPSKQDIVFVSSDDAVFFVHKGTGKVRDVVAPRKLHLYWSVISILGAIVWGLIFSLYCDRVDCSCIFRTATLSFIVFAFLFARTQLSGHPQNYARLAWQSIGALSFACAWGIAVLSCQRYASILKRIQLPLAFGLIVFLTLIFSDNNEQLIEPVLLTMISLAAPITILLCFSPAKNASLRQYDSHTQGFRFSIADTLKLATFVALLIVAFKQRNIHFVQNLSFSQLPTSCLLCFKLTLAIVVAWYVASRRDLSWLLRLAIAIAICLAIPGLRWVWAVLYQPARVIDSKLLVEDQWIILSTILFVVLGTLSLWSTPQVAEGPTFE